MSSRQTMRFLFTFWKLSTHYTDIRDKKFIWKISLKIEYNGIYYLYLVPTSTQLHTHTSNIDIRHPFQSYSALHFSFSLLSLNQ